MAVEVSAMYDIDTHIELPSVASESESSASDRLMLPLPILSSAPGTPLAWFVTSGGPSLGGLLVALRMVALY